MNATQYFTKCIMNDIIKIITKDRKVKGKTCYVFSTLVFFVSLKKKKNLNESHDIHSLHSSLVFLRHPKEVRNFPLSA